MDDNKKTLGNLKKDMEIGEEIGDLKGQLTAMENTMNQLKNTAKPTGNRPASAADTEF